MGETEPKKMVNRDVVIALGVVCILIIAIMSGILALTISNSNAAYSSYVSTHSYENSMYDYLTSEVSRLNSSLISATDQVTDLSSALRLDKQEVVYGPNPYPIPLPANFSTNPTLNEYLMDGHIPFGSYAGLAYVRVSSTSNDTYVTVNYSATNSSHQWHFDYSNQTDIGSDGIVVFPVMPSNIINIRVAVHDTSIRATANVTITYYY